MFLCTVFEWLRVIGGKLALPAKPRKIFNYLKYEAPSSPARSAFPEVKKQTNFQGLARRMAWLGPLKLQEIDHLALVSWLRSFFSGETAAATRDDQQVFEGEVEQKLFVIWRYVEISFFFESLQPSSCAKMAMWV